ncbi:transmembrane protein 106A isoform X1 [Hippopotamus amphibius kiboko]|uniref:transmembrane protein 106A isoform X1 n=1 Tax=Hippopotamus amphibius kiboko TaxID=575201 RepID=UPI0025931E46|nr:transmembrane protein 106A isoform X1 [Hippopotamus amphibius kiboko]XP_057572941.1 transmembrane protein 106A isoform X1 [Hippopotamus amphibius kiboko]XP_057572942.1 transmembrane protein 106A isoform X1 [Hippopotamus amphibius kiboko]XP_057572943.1 transmembrane protein 106A isoform X1 [Hippopotamus amphibius kiboko]
MGETFSQLGSREDEKSILPPEPAFGSNAASYSSTSSSKHFCSCVPCERAVGTSFVTCPTCQGSGEIPRELEKQLVALIPYGDKRLKPRHTKLSVFLAVFICLVTSSLIVFFLFPRTVAVQPVGLNSSMVTVDEGDIHLNITNILNISNNNYYPITVTQLTIEVLHLSLVVGQVSNSLLLHIGPLASEQMFYAVANKIRDENTYKICTWLKIKVHHVLLHIQGTLTCSYLSRSEQLVFQSYEYVDCRGSSSEPHLLVPHPP